MFDFLNATTPINLPDPVQQYVKGMSLQALTRENRMGANEERAKADEMEAKRGAAKIFAEAQSVGWDAAIANGARENPMAAQLALSLRKADETAGLDRDAKRASINKDITAADKDKEEVKLKRVGLTGNMATTLANKPQISQTELEAFRAQAKFAGTPDEVLAGMPSLMEQDKLREYMGVLGAAATDPKAQTDIWKIRTETPVDVANKQATTRQTELTTAQMPAELAVKQKNATSQAVSAGATAKNADTTRMQYDNPNFQHATDPNLGVVSFAPKTGAIAPANGPDGKPLPRPPDKYTETQGNATAYGMRMKAATQIFDAAASKIDLTSVPNRYLPESEIGNYIADPIAQKAYQAKVNFITANLRKESGAVISPSEFETEDKKYFPRQGDKPEVLEQKRQMRKLALDAMAVQSGPGNKKIDEVDFSEKPEAQAGTTFDKPPNPAQYAGRRMEKDGVVYKSDGKSWIRQ